MQKKSFIRNIIMYLSILVALLLLILVVFSASSYHTLKKEIIQSSNNFLQVYGNELKNKISKMDSMLKNMISQNVNLTMIKSADEADRAYSAISLQSYLEELMLNNDSADLIVIADSKYDIYIDASGKDISYAEKTGVRNFIVNKVDTKDKHDPIWEFIELNGTTYLYKMYLYKNRAIAVFTKTGTFLASIPEGYYGKQTFVLTDAKKIARAFFGSNIIERQEGSSIYDLDTNNALAIENDIMKSQISLICYVSKASIINQKELGMMLALVIIFLSLVFVLIFIRYTKRELIDPMKDMIVGMERIKEGEYTHRIEENYENQEFALLKDTFNQMMDEIIGLKIRFYEKRIELQETELKCIRLQIKPHFFLNAMSTISSLSSQGKTKQIKDYIEALSKNIRYMFKSGFHTVTVKEEVQQVKYYFEMQELKYPNCIFHYIELPVELESWKIPQMLLHTFIENEYKYAVSIDSMLTILIKISKVSYKEQEMLLLEIEDDGRGYPQEVLNYMNGITEKPAEDGSRIGLWSIKRMLELMYDRTDLLYLDNTLPHGCLNKVYIPREPVHEMERETIQNII